MRAIVRFLVVFVCMVYVCFGIGEARTYTNTQHGYEISYPDSFVEISKGFHDIQVDGGTGYGMDEILHGLPGMKMSVAVEKSVYQEADNTYLEKRMNEIRANHQRFLPHTTTNVGIVSIGRLHFGVGSILIDALPTGNISVILSSEIIAHGNKITALVSYVSRPDDASMDRAMDSAMNILESLHCLWH